MVVDPNELERQRQIAAQMAQQDLQERDDQQQLDQQQQDALAVAAGK